MDGIAIGPEVPEGQVYAEFQSYCKALKSIGVILAVDSKNDEANALAGLNHPDGILRPDDFVSIHANWENKDLNLKAIADELSLGCGQFLSLLTITRQSVPLWPRSCQELPLRRWMVQRIISRRWTMGGYFEVTTPFGGGFEKDRTLPCQCTTASGGGVLCRLRCLSAQSGYARDDTRI